MSAFSAVDQADEPHHLITYLDQTALGLAAMKQYMAVAHKHGGGHRRDRALRQTTAPVLDVGCGAGHDLTMLEDLGLDAIGVAPSWKPPSRSARLLDHQLDAVALKIREALRRPLEQDSELEHPNVEAQRCGEVGDVQLRYKHPLRTVLTASDAQDPHLWRSGHGTPGTRRQRILPDRPAPPAAAVCLAVGQDELGDDGTYVRCKSPRCWSSRVGRRPVTRISATGAGMSLHP